MATTKARLTKEEYAECQQVASAVTGYDPSVSPIKGQKTMQILQTVITDIQNANYTVALETLQTLQNREAFNAIRGDQVKSRLKAKN